jgi:hypothetical protein
LISRARQGRCLAFAARGWRLARTRSRPIDLSLSLGQAELAASRCCARMMSVSSGEDSVMTMTATVTPPLRWYATLEHPSPGLIARLPHEYGLRDKLTVGHRCGRWRLCAKTGEPCCCLRIAAASRSIGSLADPVETGRYLCLATGLLVALRQYTNVASSIMTSSRLMRSLTPQPARSDHRASVSRRVFRASASHLNRPSSSRGPSPTWHPNRPDERSFDRFRGVAGIDTLRLHPFGIDATLRVGCGRALAPSGPFESVVSSVAGPGPSRGGSRTSIGER